MTPNGVFNAETDCGADKRQGEGPCEQRKGFGTDHPGTGKCKFHGGATKNGKKAAQREGAELEAQRMVRLAGVDQDPIEHLLESLHLAAALVQVWGAMVAELDQATEDRSNYVTRGDLGYEEDTDEKSPYELHVHSNDLLMALNRHGEAAVHPFVAEYQKALERRAKFAKLCIDAGVAERQIRIYEQQAELAQKAFELTLDSLGLDAGQKQKARREHAGHLRVVA